MKKTIKQLFAVTAAIVSMGATAASNVSGISIPESGNLNVDGTFVSSCTAPTLNVVLGDIDFHSLANGATGVYQQNVSIPVVCTNPNQHWNIMMYVASLSFTSGVNGSNTETGFVSLSTQANIPGELYMDRYTTAQSNEANIAQQYYDGLLTLAEANAQILANGQVTQAALMLQGIGNSSVIGKLTFGKNLPVGAVPDSPAEIQLGLDGGVPMGTIDGRGAFTADIPLAIFY
jgi:hypothetical protein